METQRNKLEDYPEYLAKKDKAETLETKLRKSEKRRPAIESEASATPAHRAAHRSNLRREFEELESQEPLLREDIISARRDFDGVRRQLSDTICQQVRPAFAAQIKRNSAALQEITAANAQLERLRFELEQTGVETAAIPHCAFAIDRWSDPLGGKVSHYQRWIAEHFPELIDETK